MSDRHRQQALVAALDRELLKTELELALRRPRPTEDLAAAIESAADEVDRLIRLAEGLLVLASAETPVCA
ncbi:MAG: hypothetical protein ACR2KL_06900 [Nocardioidaceae bacterium]